MAVVSGVEDKVFNSREEALAWFDKFGLERKRLGEGVSRILLWDKYKQTYRFFANFKLMYVYIDKVFKGNNVPHPSFPKNASGRSIPFLDKRIVFHRYEHTVYSCEEVKEKHSDKMGVKGSTLSTAFNFSFPVYERTFGDTIRADQFSSEFAGKLDFPYVDVQPNIAKTGGNLMMELSKIANLAEVKGRHFALYVLEFKKEGYHVTLSNLSEMYFFLARLYLKANSAVTEQLVEDFVRDYGVSFIHSQKYGNMVKGTTSVENLKTGMSSNTLKSSQGMNFNMVDYEITPYVLQHFIQEFKRGNNEQ